MAFKVMVTRTTHYQFELENIPNLTEARRKVRILNDDEREGGCNLRDCAYEGLLIDDSFTARIIHE